MPEGPEHLRKGEGPPTRGGPSSGAIRSEEQFDAAEWDVAPALLLTGARSGFRQSGSHPARAAAARATAGTGDRLAAPHLQRPEKHVIQSDHLLSLVR